MIHGLVRVVDAAEFGSERPVVNCGVWPTVHLQHGSPISSPLDWPSPSASAIQNALFHVWPA